MSKAKSVRKIENIVVISDTHSGCKLALCPNTVKLDDGGEYHASRIQKKILQMWHEFWYDFVPKATKGEPYIVVHNGDCVDGVHHNSVTQISHNMFDQANISISLMKEVLNLPNCAGYYHIRGTEAHVGKSGQTEEGIAKALGAIPDEDGRFARWEMWMKMGKSKVLLHFTHHIGTTSSAAYESTAVYKEYIEAATEAGRYGLKPPDVVIRSHRHRAFQTIVPGVNTYAISVVTPSWQLKTPFVFRLALGRAATPQIGGIVIRSGSDVPVYIRQKIWNVERTKEVEI